MFFKASMDRVAKGITVAITLLFIVVAIGNVALFRSGEYIISVVTLLILLGIYFGIYVSRVTGYRVTTDALIVCRPLKNKEIPRPEIARGRPIEKGELAWTIRTFGNGGLYGYTGRFSNSKIGAMRWYATRREGAVLLQTTRGENILLSPDDSIGLLEALKRK